MRSGRTVYLCLKICIGWWICLVGMPAMAEGTTANVDKQTIELFQILEGGSDLDPVLDRNRWPKNELLVSYLEWELLFHPRYKTTTERLHEFLNRWPNHAQIDRVQSLLEFRITRDGNNEEALALYDRSPPKSENGQLRYLRLLLGKKRFQDAMPIWKPLYLEGVIFADDLEQRTKPLEKQLTQAEREVRIRKLLHSGPKESYERVFNQLPSARQAYFRTLDAALHGLENFENLRSQLPPTEASDTEIWDAQAHHFRRTMTRRNFVAFLLGKHSGRLSAKARQLFRFQIGRDLYNEGELAAAMSLLRVNVLEAGGKLSDSLWLAAWSAYLLGNHSQALAWFGQLALEGSNGPMRAQGGVWAAKLSASKAEKEKWLAVAAQYPEGFYGLLAQEQSTGRLAALPADPHPCPTTWGSAVEPHLDSLRLLKAVGRSHHNGAEIRNLAQRLGLSQTDQICLAKEFGAADLAVQLANSLRKGQEQLFFSALYPTPDWQPLSGWSIDPALVWSTTRQESLFFHRAESRTKAQGLMQLMPATALEEAKRIDVAPATRHLLQSPAYNLTLGQSYLSRMLRLFEGDLVLAVASYNAGPGRGSSWRANREKEDPIAFIEKIPFAETREYVKKVLHGWAIYRLQQQKTVSLDSALKQRKQDLSLFSYNKAE
ncbi:MAG: lytic transglycosylase domain-containing protein [Magnetococcales bacterium]|nr:lytic transglycosylase domain-containing protein [Magnetococcales bacterium]